MVRKEKKVEHGEEHRLILCNRARPLWSMDRNIGFLFLYSIEMLDMRWIVGNSRHTLELFNVSNFCAVSQERHPCL